MFEKSLTDGKIPREWKEANVTAVYKQGARKKPENYRPVSLTIKSGRKGDGKDYKEGFGDIPGGKWTDLRDSIWL